MLSDVGNALVAFDARLRALRAALASDPELSAAAFDGAEEWLDLLRYKLIPHLAGEGCLIVAVAGGTNCGKSTLFNLLLGAAVSPVVATAAATRHPVLAASRARTAQCLGGQLVPEFHPLPIDHGAGVLSQAAAPEALFVAEAPGLPERLALLDTPDIDSIDKQNWRVADNIRAAGDVLVAVLTGEKYKDERVVAFFRQALASGRVVLPLMNKANPDDDYAVARQQLNEFCAETGVDGPCFVLPHDFRLSKTFAGEVRRVDGPGRLLDYLESLDVPTIKRRVYGSTLIRFAEQAAEFVDRLDGLGGGLEALAAEFEARAKTVASYYDPAPGPEMSGLFHAFVQGKRGRFERTIGAASTAVLKGVTAIARKTTGALLRRATLHKEAGEVTEDALRAEHLDALARLTRDLATGYIQSARSAGEPAAHLLEAGLDGLNMEKTVAAVSQETLRMESISEDFRRHATATLNEWWNDHKVKRRVLIALDGLLFITPTAIAIPISLHTGGFGVTESMIVAGTVGEQFLARVIEYQFGDAMFNLLAPWRAEQRQTFEDALCRHLTEPCLARVRHYLEALGEETVADLRRCLDPCRNA